MSRRPDNDSRAPARLDPETRRALLVQAAADVFRGREPNEVGFEEVADAAGVSRSLVYAYFGDRGGLTAAVYLHELEALDQALGRASNRELPDEVRLRRIVRRYLVFARDHPDAWHLMTTVSVLQHPAIQAARAARVDRIAESWGQGPEARLVASSVIGFLESAAQHWVEHRPCGLDRATRLLFSVIWGGLATVRGDGAPDGHDGAGARRAGSSTAPAR